MVRVKSALAFIFATLVVLSAALWNGYPLVFYDTGDYIAQSFTFVPLIYRTFPYSLFLKLAHWDLSLWLPAVVQAMLTTWVIREALVAFAPYRHRDIFLLAGTVCLAALSALPWIAGQLMPDAFCAPEILSLAILMFERDRLSTSRRIVLILIAALGAFSHLSHLALAIGLSGFAGLLWLSSILWRQYRPRIAGVFLAMGVAFVTIPSVNFILTGRIFFSESGPVFLIARMTQDGLVQKYLAENCDRHPNPLCGFQAEFPNTANDLLWTRDSILVRLGGWYAFRPIAQDVITASLKADPVAHLLAALRNTAIQVTQLKAGEGLFNQWQTTKDMVQRYFPEEADAYNNSRQQQEQLDFNAINAIQAPVALAALAMMPFIIFLQFQRKQMRVGLFGLTLLVAILGNAAICGILSNPTDRYQARVAWLPIAYLFISAVNFIGANPQTRLSRL